MKSNYLRMLGNITVLPPQILPWFLVRDWGSNVPKTSFQESNIIFKSGKKEDCAPSYLCFRLCHLISGLGPVFWFLPHLWCSYSCLGCNTSVCLLPHQSYGTHGHTGDALPSCVLVLTIQENEAATALRRIQLDITTFCFNAVITKSLEQH